MSLRLRLISSRHKYFHNMPADSFECLKNGTVLRNDLFCFEALLDSDKDCRIRLNLISELAPYTRVFRIESVHVALPTYEQNTDSDYLNNKQPGLYPDLMLPYVPGDFLELKAGQALSVWLEIHTPEDLPAGEYPVTVSVNGASAQSFAHASLSLDVIPAVLPEQRLIYTQWLHCDCLATYYHVEPFSDTHWQIVENFVRAAAENGVNMLLMPLFTPPLDTAVGGERPTVQLVGVTYDTAAKTYSFDFRLVDRWLSMCERCGIRYHEATHLFTQWGAEHAPKIMATVDGGYKRIFGWETDSLSEEYLSFVKQFLAAFKAYLRSKGLLERTMFHLSDEPYREHLERYKKLREALAESLEGCTCGDALSNYEFYKTGAVQRPIVAIDHIEPFLSHHTPHLWGYHCCSQHQKVSNRFIAMPMNRTRMIGIQLFKYRLEGFLQWGCNFYYSQYSARELNPYECNDGGGWVPAGDAFSLYPGPNGIPYPSLHMLAFTQALYDLRAFELLASLTSHEETVALTDGMAGSPITFTDYPREEDFAERVRETVNQRIGSLCARKS
ncbi:MAG: glycoside hydrolase domain-containing protein [Eubacteriales bacterium]